MYLHDIVDIHSHIVFGTLDEIDDGSSSLKESLDMLRRAWDEGVRTVFATPHYGAENVNESDASLVQERFEELRKAARRELPDMALYLGTEWYCSDDLPARVQAGKAFTMNGTNHVLLEFLDWEERCEPAEIILGRLQMMAQSEYIPILAHAERYRHLRENYGSFRRIKEMGVLIQVNAYDLLLNPSESTRNAAQFLAHERMIDFLGSDMHGLPPKRAPLMQAGVQWLYENTDSAYADAVVHDNAMRLLVNRL